MICQGLTDPTRPQGVFLFVGKHLLQEGPIPIGEVYDKHKAEDGFLYVHFAENNPF